jgi:hypothetical protein
MLCDYLLVRIINPVPSISNIPPFWQGFALVSLDLPCKRYIVMSRITIFAKNLRKPEYLAERIFEGNEK